MKSRTDWEKINFVKFWKNSHGQNVLTKFLGTSMKKVQFVFEKKLGFKMYGFVTPDE